ncbi:hypothetical protein OUZ56_003255 [Daphnia magna]|uniref:Uncharacterized protein n=1 Tax=Daphnia magna TaxID=35525 RepID=A0ABR0A8F6_9CRUS|nr:hypothetical protein OUZ56_003255 [Daphnia magna]
MAARICNNVVCSSAKVNDLVCDHKVRSSNPEVTTAGTVHKLNNIAGNYSSVVSYSIWDSKYRSSSLTSSTSFISYRIAANTTHQKKICIDNKVKNKKQVSSRGPYGTKTGLVSAALANAFAVSAILYVESPGLNWSVKFSRTVRLSWKVSLALLRSFAV